VETIRTEPYDIYIGSDSLGGLNSLLAKGKYTTVFILTDQNTKKHCLRRLQISSFASRPFIITIKSGEKNKNIRTCEKIWNELSKQNADRKSLLINLGGGVITDTGGFCASVYKRGIDFINIPTTLLAMADASVGGKTGIDFNLYKNQIGVFAFPKAVFINPHLLKTLPKRELVSGFSEVIKHGLIADRSYWNAIKGIKDLKETGSNLISRSIEIKNKIVTDDPFEKGIRKTLNFGHTIGHAIESASLRTTKPLLHGEAIAIGMICEAYLSRKCCGLSSDELDEITSFISRFYPPKKSSVSEKKLIGLMKQDKKNREDEINFTLLRTVGTVEINNSCSEDLIGESIQFYNSLCQ
jgi:3-dehydroquinate synthase